MTVIGLTTAFNNSVKTPIRIAESFVTRSRLWWRIFYAAQRRTPSPLCHLAMSGFVGFVPDPTSYLAVLYMFIAFGGTSLRVLLVTNAIEGELSVNPNALSQGQKMETNF